VPNSLCVKLLRSPILAALLHGTPAAGVSQTLRCGTINGITELSQRAPPIFGWAAITLGISPHSSYALPSATALLEQLHWLPVEWRIRFKLATMTLKASHTGRPPYLTDQLQYYQPTRSLRSSGSHQLVKPRHNLFFGSRAFRISAPHIWN